MSTIPAIRQTFDKQILDNYRVFGKYSEEHPKSIERAKTLIESCTSLIPRLFFPEEKALIYARIALLNLEAAQLTSDKTIKKTFKCSSRIAKWKEINLLEKAANLVQNKKEKITWFLRGCVIISPYTKHIRSKYANYFILSAAYWRSAGEELEKSSHDEELKKEVEQVLYHKFSSTLFAAGFCFQKSALLVSSYASFEQSFRYDRIDTAIFLNQKALKAYLDDDAHRNILTIRVVMNMIELLNRTLNPGSPSR